MDMQEVQIYKAFDKWAYEPGTEEEEKIWQNDDYDFSRVTFRAGYLAAISAPVASDARELAEKLREYTLTGRYDSYFSFDINSNEAAALIERYAAERERKAREEEREACAERVVAWSRLPYPDGTYELPDEEISAYIETSLRAAIKEATK